MTSFRSVSTVFLPSMPSLGMQATAVCVLNRGRSSSRFSMERQGDTWIQLRSVPWSCSLYAQHSWAGPACGFAVVLSTTEVCWSPYSGVHISSSGQQLCPTMTLFKTLIVNTVKCMILLSISKVLLLGLLVSHCVGCCALYRQMISFVTLLVDANFCYSVCLIRTV